MAVIGHHALIDFFEVARERLTDADLLSGALQAAAGAAGMTPLSAPVIHRFPGGGLTGFLPLAESHIAFHTYPEHGYIALDIFTCGEAGPDAAVDVLWGALHPGQESVRIVPRGDLASSPVPQEIQRATAKEDGNDIPWEDRAA